MANEKNLIPNDERSPSEVRENGRKGGIKSGEVRREKAKMKSAVKLLFSLPVKDPKIKEQVKALGIDEKDIDNSILPIIGIYNKAIKGNVQAARLLAELNEENDVQGVTKIGASGKLVFDFGDEKNDTED
jgi:hypothetical protein